MKFIRIIFSLILIISLSGCKKNIKPDTDNNTVIESFNCTEMEKTEAKYGCYDLFSDVLSTDIKNNLLVIYISFAGEPAVDRADFENLFIKDYPTEKCMYSVKSYFRQNFYGRDLLDFTFVYYDCPMTVEQAWHYVNDEDKYGNYVGNDFLFDVFDELQKKGMIESNKLDSNHNGYIDATLFILGDRASVDDCFIYGGAMGHTSKYEIAPDVNNPVLGNYIKVSADSFREKLMPASLNHENIRVLLHEISHLFGLLDYYDCYPYNDEIIDTLGCFDMQDNDVGDWNAYSRFSCRLLKPYVITEDIESVTLRLRCSSLYDDAVLIPTSKGYNNTAFDEYILIDVMAPAAANGFDWQILKDFALRNDEICSNSEGGVRISHVDARLLCQSGNSYSHIEDLDETVEQKMNCIMAYTNSNGYDPYIEGESQFYHHIDIIPADGTDKFRICRPTNWSAFAFLSTNDLFKEGDVFNIEKYQDCFVNGTLMNNGGTLDYEVKIEFYNPVLMEAVVTISRIQH